MVLFISATFHYNWFLYLSTNLIQCETKQKPKPKKNPEVLIDLFIIIVQLKKKTTLNISLTLCKSLDGHILYIGSRLVINVSPLFSFY